MYDEWRRRKKRMLRRIPMKQVVNDVQYINAMLDWGLNPSDTDKIEELEMGNERVRGWIYQKKDRNEVHDKLLSISAEFKGLMENDQFVIEGFYREMIETNYLYTYDITETIYRMGLDEAQFYGDERLVMLMRTAIERVRQEFPYITT